MSLTGSIATTDLLVQNDGFFFALSSGEFSETYRIPNSYTDATIANAITLAMVETNLRLADFKTHIKQTYTSLAEYMSANPNPLGDSDLLEIIYKKAVFCFAKAFLLNEANGISKAKESDTKIADLNATADYWIKEAERAIYIAYGLIGITANSGITKTNGVHLL